MGQKLLAVEKLNPRIAATVLYGLLLSMLLAAPVVEPAVGPLSLSLPAEPIVYYVERFVSLARWVPYLETVAAEPLMQLLVCENVGLAEFADAVEPVVEQLVGHVLLAVFVGVSSGIAVTDLYIAAIIPLSDGLAGQTLLAPLSAEAVPERIWHPVFVV